MIKIRDKYLDNITSEEWSCLSKLRLHDGILYPTCKRYFDLFNNKDIRVFIVEEDEKIVAWAIIGMGKHKNTPLQKGSMMYYVKRSHRRKGIGKRIFRRMISFSIKNNIEIIKGSMWNLEATSFYEKMKNDFCKKNGIKMRHVNFYEYL